MYEEGHTLELRIEGADPPLVVRVQARPVDFSLSAVMVVDVLSRPDETPLPSKAFLKLYDRRYATEYRKKQRLEDWTPELEGKLVEFSRSGAAQSFLKRWQDDDDFDDDGSWGVAEKEVCLWDTLNDDFETEVEVYEALEKHQGKLIPQLYTTVSYFTDPDNGGPVGDSPELFTVSGILIEYIDGFRMSDMYIFLDRSEWNYIIDRAVKVTGAILNRSNVLNQDVRPDNMLVSRDENAEQGYRIVMIDFGCCRLRDDDETDAEWGLAKQRQDEEGAMGEIMKIKLKKQADFVVEYERPRTWCMYAEGTLPTTTTLAGPAERSKPPGAS
ncbi:hypothetical protein G7Z17_g2047 [Cylindrodendrum hubeiense]|uniref:Protein kinase domain-containing protein n=1 Tax=Cylindrodendrum hubeiense TaxID=595255 RepID=A0A9P5LJH5_9HYPO|nr:hypothetical protein G7Z17_g2047 [Cylindrodendrum hubeiense]